VSTRLSEAFPEEYNELRRILSSKRFSSALQELASRRVASALGLEPPGDPAKALRHILPAVYTAVDIIGKGSIDPELRDS
jgi:hypothetical protein